MQVSALAEQADLLRLNPASAGAEKVLFLPPISGHSGYLLQDLAKPLVSEFDVHVLDWKDPLTLDPREANYGQDTQVDLTVQAITSLDDEGGPTHVVAVCQACSPTLLALASPGCTARSLTLIAAPLFDAPGGAAEFFSDSSPDEALNRISALTHVHPTGARVLPATTQLSAIMNGEGGALRNLHAAMTMEVLPLNPAARLHATTRRLSLLDGRNIPHRLLIEGLTPNFIERRHIGIEIDDSMPVHLVCGENDTVVPPLQTTLFTEHFPQSTINLFLFSGLDHFDLFASGAARTNVSAGISAFLRGIRDR